MRRQVVFQQATKSSEEDVFKIGSAGHCCLVEERGVLLRERKYVQKDALLSRCFWNIA